MFKPEDFKDLFEEAMPEVPREFLRLRAAELASKRLEEMLLACPPKCKYCEAVLKWKYLEK